MSIKKKLSVLVIFTGVFMTLVLGCLFWAEQNIGASLKKSQGAFSLLSGITELNLLANEYDGGNVNRLSRQWFMRAKRLQIELHAFEKNYPGTIGLDRLEREFDKAGELIGTFVGLSSVVGPRDPQAIFRARRNLLNHITIVLGSVESSAKLISEQAMSEIDSVQHFRNAVLIVLSVLTCLFALTWERFLSDDILAPLRQLFEGVLRVRDGRLGHTIDMAPRRKDEISALMEAFNEMSEQLERVTVSRDELQKEVRERKRAQRQVFAAGERERSRIGRELHDGICQDITAIRVHLGNIASQMVYAEDSEERVMLLRLRDYTQKVLDDIRRLIMDLRPAMLDDIGLVATLRWKCRQIRKAHGLHVSLQLLDDESQVPDDMKGPLYRIVQEALGNVLKHSGGDQADIRMLIEDDVLWVNIEDNGRGFAEEGSPELGSGYGLSNMQERARAFGGEFYIRSGSSGTTVTVKVPLTPQADETHL